MAKIGRNQPCPCGSGRKYKRCCLQAARVRITAEERIRARQLMSWIAAPGGEWADEVEDAAYSFDVPYAEADSDPRDENPSLDEVSAEVFESWFVLDRELEAEGRLGRPVDLLLADRSLSSGVRAYLEQAANTRMRLYEVTSLEPGSTVTLRDLHTRREVTVHDKLGSRNMQRWQLLAARVVPEGPSGGPELDLGVLPLPRHVRPWLVAKVAAELADAGPPGSGISEDDILRCLPPDIHALWLYPFGPRRVPDLQNTDSEELVLTRVVFEVASESAIVAALDERFEIAAPGESWNWIRPADGQRQGVVLGFLTLAGGRLELDVNSAERAERGRALLEALAPGALRYRVTATTDPEQALKEATPEERAPASGEDRPEEFDDAVLEVLMKHYKPWIDEAIPALDGKTPREAAADKGLRDRLVAMLADLEHAYLRGLAANRPGHDPSWMWSELGLGDHADAPWVPDYTLQGGYASLEPFLPGLGAVASKIAETRRTGAEHDPHQLISDADVASDVSFRRFQNDTSEAEGGYGEADLATLVRAFASFELHRRKTFWLDESVAWMLANTGLSVVVDDLRLPFVSFVLAFTDRPTLAVAERWLAALPGCRLRARMLRIISVYVTSRGEGAVDVLLVADTRDGDRPFAVNRRLTLAPGAQVDSICAAFRDDPRPLRKLLELTLNAVLYATSADVSREELTPPKQREARRPAPPGAAVSSDNVYYLPGKIPIRLLRRLQAVERHPSASQLMHRFLVRGHWRRPARNYKDQGLRWIRPYWKGPDLAAVVEREYQLRD